VPLLDDQSNALSEDNLKHKLKYREEKCQVQQAKYTSTQLVIQHCESAKANIEWEFLDKRKIILKRL